MTEVLNRWNRKWYKVLEIKDRDVTLQREDNSVLIIERKELFANYTNILHNKELEKLLEK